MNQKNTKIIVETQTKKENWVFKIFKSIFNIILFLLPFILIVGGIYWVLFKFFPEIFHQINAYAGEAATKTKNIYDKITAPIRNGYEKLYNLIAGKNNKPNNNSTNKTKLGSYLATTLSVIGICLGLGKIGNWFKGKTKKALNKGTKKVIQKTATSKLTNWGGKLLRFGSKAIFLISLASTAYELYQFYQEETTSPKSPKQPIENKIINPPTRLQPPIIHTPNTGEAINSTKSDNLINSETPKTPINNRENEEENIKEEIITKMENTVNPC